MRVVALISGGKDSCYNMFQCIAANHQIVALAHMRPKDTDELDSFMYQCVGQEAVSLFAEALELPLYQENISGSAVCSDADYVPTEGDEVEVLHRLLDRVKLKEQIEAVSVGAIMSNYQRVRVENVCSRLGLTVLAYMWRRDQEELLAEMIAANMRAIVVKVATLGLNPCEHLGKDISELFPHLLRMRERFGLNVCGEGGEYETFTLDCPLFKKSIEIEEQVTVIQDSNDIAPVAYVKFKKFRLKDKPNFHKKTQREIVKDVGIRGPLNYLVELDIDLSAPVERSLSSQTVPSFKIENWKFGVPRTTRLDRGWSWLSGIVATSEGTIEKVTTSALERLVGLLSDRQMTIANLVAVQLFVADMSDFASLNASYRKFFGLNPANVLINYRVCVQVPSPSNIRFTLECLAYDGSDTVKHMHVQSVSHWAPANIGPYSQAVQVGNLIYVAGQIALVPGSMEMVAGGIVPECRLSLQHVQRVLVAMEPGTSLCNAVVCICYITDPNYVNVARVHWLKETQESLNDRTCPLPVDYVVVTGLPRGAKVEWQVIAHNGSSECTYKFLSYLFSDVNVTLKGSITRETQKEDVEDQGQTIIYTRYETTSDTVEVNEFTMEKIFQHLKQLTSENCPNSYNSSHFQVYFNVTSTLTHSQITKSWTNVNGVQNGLSLIPVVSHPDEPSVFLSIILRF